MKWNKGLAVLLLMAGCATVDPVQDGGYRMSQALLQNQPVPMLSERYGKALTLAGAYRIQHLALEQVLQGRAPAGFKAGLTSAASQRQFGAAEPVAGVLPAGARLRADPEEGYQLARRNYRQPMVELEVGFRFAHRISGQLPDVQSLRTHVAAVLPVIEIPDLGHEGEAPPQLADIVAANVFAKQFIAGPERAPGLTDPNAVAVTLYRDGNLLAQGGGRDVQGDQWQALLWLVNRSVASGWTIEPGQVLLTGSMGAPVPLQPGLYVADFGGLGRIEWAVQ
jgi:2-keto-4-pentenoate hydratase